MRSPYSAPLVPTVGYNTPLKRVKSTKAYPSPPSPRPTTSPPAVQPFSANRTEEVPPTRHASQPIPVGTQRPVVIAPSSSTHSFDSIGTSDESSAPLSMKPLRQTPANTTTFKKSPPTNVSVFADSLQTQMAALPVIRLPKLKTPSLRPKTAPTGSIPPRASSNKHLTSVTLFKPSHPIPLSPMSPAPAGGPVSPGLLSPPRTSSFISHTLPFASLTHSPVLPPQALTAVPQLPSKIPNFIATYSTVPSQKITAPKPPTGPKDPTRQSFRTLRLVQASLGTLAPAPLSPSNSLQAPSHKHQGGGYVTDTLYVPHSVWHTPEAWIFVSNLGDKVKALEALQESLRVVQGATVALFGSIARPQALYPRVEHKGSLSGLQVQVPSGGVRSRGAQEWITSLEGLLATLSQLELGMGKKLGLGEGVTSSTGSVSRTKRMKDWSTRVARKSFGVGSGKASSALGAEYVAALGAVCAGTRLLDGHGCTVARLTPYHQSVEGRPIREDDVDLVEALTRKYQGLPPQQVLATRAALEKIAAAMGSIIVPFVLRDLGVLMESLLDNNGDADWMGAV